MYIKKIELFNIDKLFNIAASCLEQKDIVGKQFERNIIQIYNQMSITYYIDSINEVEYFHMKYILQEGNITEFENKSGDFRMEYVNSTFPEISTQVRQVKRVVSPVIHAIPACLIDGSCIVTLTGSDLALLFKTDPMREFFVKIIPEDELQNRDHSFNRENANKMFKNGEVKDEKIERFLNELFLGNFYKSMISNHEYVDILSDFSMRENFFNKAGGIELVSVNNISTKDNEFINKLTSLKNTLNNAMDNCKLSFVCKTPFHLFLKCYESLPKRCFTAIESFRIPHSVVTDTDYNLFNLNTNEYEVVKKMEKAINESYGVKGKEIAFASMIPNYSRINYTLKLTLNDINNIPYRGEEFENEIRSKILKYGKNVYKIVTE